jgi:hypothetical protein
MDEQNSTSTQGALLALLALLTVVLVAALTGCGIGRASNQEKISKTPPPISGRSPLHDRITNLRHAADPPSSRPEERRHQYWRPSRLASVGGRFRESVMGGGRQREGNASAALGTVLGPNVAALCLDQALRDRKPQPGAVGAA